MNPIQAFKSCFLKSFVFKGRAVRSEYWHFLWIGLVISLVPHLGPVLCLLLLPAYISVLVRRLHDTDRSGWFYWLSLIPLIGTIILIEFLASKGTSGTNRFGEEVSE